MPGSNGRRKYKLERRRRMTSEQTLSSLMGLCRRQGLNVTNPQDLPDVIACVFEELSARGGASFEVEIEGQPAAVVEVAGGVDLAPDANLLVDQEPEGQQHLAIEEQVDFGEDQFEAEPEPALMSADAPESEWEMSASDLLSSRPRSPAPAPAPRAAAPRPASPAGKPTVDPSMIQQFKDKQGQVLQRVAKNGVQYRNSPGPAQGQKISPHASVADRVSRLQAAKAANKQQPVQASQEESDFDGGSPDDDRINPKTGMSLRESRDIISRVTGKTPRPPKPGGLNTLKP